MVCHEGAGARVSAKEANLQPRRFGAGRLSADLAPGMDPRLAKKERSRRRAEQHRAASAQGRIESWQEYEANYPEELDYYEIARAKVSGRLRACSLG